MNNEELTITNASADVTVEHPEQENKTEPESQEKPLVKSNESKTKTEKLLERLATLKDRYEKAVTAQATAEKKTQDIYEQIVKVENDIRAETLKELQTVCGEKNLSYDELAEFIRAIPDDMTLEEIQKMISE